MSQAPPPSTRRVEVVDTLHGVRVEDPYRWLEDEHAPDVQAWMSHQDLYARAVLAGLPGHDELATRLAKLLYFDATSAPVHRKGRYFWTRKHQDKEKTVVYWKVGADGAEHVLFDPNTWSDDGSTGLGGWWPSHDGKVVAYAVKQHNSDETVTHVIALDDDGRQRELPDVIAGTKYSAISWLPDGSGFYYTWVPAVGGAVTIADRPGFAELRFHRLGDDPAGDATMFPATGNPRWFVGGGVSYDGRWEYAEIAHGWNSSDLHVRRRGELPERGPVASRGWTPLVAGVDAIFELAIWRDRFYVRTNDGAPCYRIYKVDPDRPARDAWREIVAESDATLLGMTIVGEHLALAYLRDAVSEVAIHDLDGARTRALALPPLGTTGGISGNPDEDTGYLGYTSFTEPHVIYECSIASGEVREWSRITLPIDTSQLVTRQVRYTSKDGTPITMFLVHRADAVRDGRARVMLSGYGGFNVSQTPGFSATRALFVERGGVFALPNLRGGGEYGERWHRAGMLLAKQNVFDDYIAAAEYLIAEGWTSPAHLGIAGGSNGGLLVGAALAQRPSLYRAVVCAVPLLDMLRYHLYGSGKTWIEEYGSADDPAQFQALHAYSPYRAVVEGAPAHYPAVLFDSADHDDRVDPMHARKLAAALQARQLGDGPILLRIERNAGHGGADMVKQQVSRAADLIAFFEALLGKESPAGPG